MICDRITELNQLIDSDLIHAKKIINNKFSDLTYVKYGCVMDKKF